MGLASLIEGVCDVCGSEKGAEVNKGITENGLPECVCVCVREHKDVHLYSYLQRIVTLQYKSTCATI